MDPEILRVPGNISMNATAIRLTAANEKKIGRLSLNLIIKNLRQEWR